MNKYDMIDLSESGGRRVGENKALTSKKGRFKMKIGVDSIRHVLT